ncbi:MAG TPA: hypothetical protein VHA10_07950 [Hypericibacter adhaerens]|jgi:hypothetical protein|uniref:Transglutaminase-like domain-containing protein n=1 Tax=Hypericibacter adhaerens TaxID=2602016 RepID=A0A5J6N0V0_9PROT|nr:hypothetical protein [Hypericibacter adhaerens]QEX22884.1 hypothetical protein FRZ61_28180 [Hypericibacter adhaerens]HWA43128.1 hypothetical protein [Hypericibacter adhaerens]
MTTRFALGQQLGLTRTQTDLLLRLRTPERIQDFVTSLEINHELDGDSCLSVVGVLEHRHAHCIEGAFVAACALWLQGEPPLLMDFHAEGDDDHVVTLFKRGDCWGAISKSNHVWLRWRDPVYRSLRELAISYLHEYVNDEKKTLRAYSRPFDLRRVAPERWVTSPKPCWDVAQELDEIRHYRLISKAQARRLKDRDEFELQLGRQVEFVSPKPLKSRAAARS